MKKIQGTTRVACSRISGANGGMRLQITDESSGVRVAELRFTLEDFARLLTGEQFGGVTAEWSTEFIGWTRRTVKRLVEYPSDATPQQREVAVEEHADSLARMTVSQVRAHADDVHNHHRWRESSSAGVTASLVTFWLYYPPDITREEQDRLIASLK